MTSLVAEPNDRFDLIALRVYGDNSAPFMRTLIWANDDLPPVIPEGTVIQTPEPAIVAYARGYTRLNDNR